MKKIKKGLPKIEYLVIETIIGNNAWEKEFFSRDFAYKRIKELATDNDYIINTDLDEIVNSEILLEYKNKNISEIFSLEMDLYYYNCNWKKKTKWYLGTFGPLFLINSFQNCRNNISRYNKIKNAGWHLSYFLTPEQISYKISSFSHTEFDNEIYKSLENIKNSIQKGLDLFSRGDHENLILSNDYLPKNISVLPKMFQRNLT